MLRLKLLNSLYAIEASTEYAHQCMRLIGEKHLRGDVHVSTAFLDHEETLRELGDSDLVVLPYLYSTESSSAAGAFAVASLRPVLCSDLPLFDELADVIHRFPQRQCHRFGEQDPAIGRGSDGAEPKPECAGGIGAEAARGRPSHVISRRWSESGSILMKPTRRLSAIAQRREPRRSKLALVR